MKILFVTIGDQTVASSRVRVYGYLPFLAKKNIEYKILVFTSSAKCKRILELKKDNPLQYLFELLHKIGVILKLFFYSKKYDIIFIQKVVLPKMAWDILKTLNKNIVFDFDDAIYLHRDIRYIVRDAACTIVSNRKLETWRGMSLSRNVQHLMSPVDVNNQVLRTRKGFVTLGWIGSPETSKYLYIILPVLRDLKNRFQNLNIEFMGAKRNRDFESLGIIIHEWSIDKQDRFLNEIDIGIMPLDNDEWSCSKAGYKLLLYMSRGIPCAASPVGVNTDLIKNGENGYCAETHQEWLDKLSRMIEDPSLRRRMGEEGKKIAERYYSYKVCAPIMYDILTSIRRK